MFKNVYCKNTNIIFIRIDTYSLSLYFKNIYFLTSKQFVFDTIENVIGYPIRLISNLSECRIKIDILIIDWQDSESIYIQKHFSNRSQYSTSHHIKYLINIGEKVSGQYKMSNFHIQKEIFISRPFSLIIFRDMINSLIHDHLPFLMIDDQYIFDCQNSRFYNIHYPNIDTKLTEKEMQILQHMLFSEHYMSNKSKLGKMVWDFNYTINTSTIETHIYKLKQKVNDIIVVDKTKYFLNVREIY